MDRVGRREFLKASAVTVGALVLEACGGGSSGPHASSDPSTPTAPVDTSGTGGAGGLGVYANYHAGDDITAALGATCVRNSTAWQRDATGTWVSVAKNVWRDNHHPVGAVYAGRQFIAEPTAINIAPNGCGFGTNGTAGWSVATTGGAKLSVADDAAKITGAGLQLLAGDPMCLVLDNSAGATPADASVPLGTLTAGPYTFQVYARGGTGSLFLNQGGAIGQVAFGSNGNYANVVSRNVTAAASPATLSIRADPGQVVQFLLTQVEASASETTPMPNATNGTIKRVVDKFTWPFPAPPGPMSIYMRRTWTPPFQFNPYLGIGDADAGTGLFIHLGFLQGTHTRLVNEATASVSGDTNNPNIGDDCMIVGRFDSSGNGQVEQSLNGLGSTFSAPATDSIGYGSSFLVPTAAVGRYTGAAIPIVGSHIVMAKSTSASLATFEAL